MNRIASRYGLLLRAGITCLVLLSFSACGKREPVYNGVSVMGQNYLPYNLDSFTVTDAYGNRASGWGGAGGLSCCYKLKGTEFTVQWDYYDADQWHKGDKQTFHGEATVSMPPTTVPAGAGENVLEVHFYPDRHVEFQMPGDITDEERVPLAGVTGWMFERYEPQLSKRYPERDDQQARRIARVAAGAWLKYKLTDLEDMGQYVYFNLLVNSRFDAHPEVQKILQATKGKPGEFAKEIKALSPEVMKQLETDRFQGVAVPVIADGLLPPPRVKDNDHE